MKAPILCTSLLSVVSASTQVPGSASDTDSLYGYGVGIGGLPFIYADGLAYLGSAPLNASSATNVSVAVTSGHLAVTPTGNVTWPDSKTLYVNTKAGACDSAKIASSADGYTNTGFMFYGRVLFQTGSSGMSSLFYATPLDSQNQTYALKWNSGSADDGLSVPVALRTIPPS